MKLWNNNSRKGKRFYRRNRAPKMKKSIFFREYYLILHNVYYQKNRFCLLAIKQKFLEIFGKEPDSWSISYLSDTEDFFANEEAIEDFQKRGQIISEDLLIRLLIEIGFDLFLLYCTEKEIIPSRKEFQKWLPLVSNRKNKKHIKCFYKRRLPKKKDIASMSIALSENKGEIAKQYRKIIEHNRPLLAEGEKKEAILSFLDSIEALSLSSKEVPSDTTFVKDTLSENNLSVEMTEIMDMETMQENAAFREATEAPRAIEEKSSEDNLPLVESIEESGELNVEENINEDVELTKENDFVEASKLTVEENIEEDVEQTEEKKIEEIQELNVEESKQEYFEQTEEEGIKELQELNAEDNKEGYLEQTEDEGIKELQELNAEESKQEYFEQTEEESIEEIPIVTKESTKDSKKKTLQYDIPYSKKPITKVKGFQNGKKISKKKAITCVSCVAIATAFLIPIFSKRS